MRSLARQTYRHFEVIVVRDGGTPVDQVVTGWQHELPITLLGTDQPLRVSHARNLALSHARGEHVALLDDDDVFLPHHLADAADALRDGQADAVYGQALVSHTWIEALPRTPHGLPRKDCPFDAVFLAVANTIHTGSLVIRNPASTPVRFDETMTHCGDWDFLLALHHTAGYRFNRLNTITCIYHQLPRPGAVTSAAPRPSPVPRPPSTSGGPPRTGAKAYREWFREFDDRIDARVVGDLPVAPHL
ncbi:glycosyltransferase family 2 protein [Streptomyces sp. DSM 116496]|uniref:glycosyltransferase family 2 protein n=1 Tax=Streptomyces stoeckheimensis TaxID=3344656 RepID=UPI0038B23B2B